MSAEVIPLRRSHARKDGWREQVRQDALGRISDFAGQKPQPGEKIRSKLATHMRARPMSEATVYRYHLAAWQLAEHLDDPEVTTITRADIEAFIVHRMETTKGSTVAGTFTALAQFFKFVTDDVRPDVFTAPTDGMTTPVFEERVIDVPDAELLAKIIRHARDQRDEVGAKTFEGIRDEAILRMFVDTGARLAEVTMLTLHDNLGDRVRVIGKSKGKGPVERQVCISSTTQQALKRYLRARNAHPAAGNDRLFLGRKGPMTPSGVRQMVWRRSKALGTRIHPHQFRHAFAHGWKSSPNKHDGDLMEIMGWRTEAMLHRYGRAAARERALDAHKDYLEGRA